MTANSVSGHPTAKQLWKTPVSASSMQLQQALKSSRTSSYQVSHLYPFLTTGIGGFTILDDKITDGEDAGVTFFLDESCIGLPRAQEACKMLQEMNPDVSGSFVIRVCLFIILTNS
jgi:NEDD8-activating enzyme E1 regulatory subunit